MSKLLLSICTKRGSFLSRTFWIAADSLGVPSFGSFVSGEPLKTLSITHMAAVAVSVSWSLIYYSLYITALIGSWMSSSITYSTTALYPYIFQPSVGNSSALAILSRSWRKLRLNEVKKSVWPLSIAWLSIQASSLALSMRLLRMIGCQDGIGDMQRRVNMPRESKYLFAVIDWQKLVCCPSTAWLPALLLRGQWLGKALLNFSMKMWYVTSDSCTKSAQRL